MFLRNQRGGMRNHVEQVKHYYDPYTNTDLDFLRPKTYNVFVKEKNLKYCFIICYLSPLTTGYKVLEMPDI